MATLLNPNAYLASGLAEEITGSAHDMRHVLNHGYLWFQASGHSAIFNFEASHDTTGWLPIATYTATATQTGTAQVAGFFPYVRANVVEVYSAAGGSGNLWVHWSPVL